MVEYLIAACIMAVVIGIASYISYPGASERTVKLCTSVIFLCALLSPIAPLLEGLPLYEVDFDGLLEDTGVSGGEYKQVAEEAFADGIRQLLFTKYGLNEGDVRVLVTGFEFEKMRAERINIILSGKGALADWRGIEEYITEAGLGECEVTIE